MAAERRHFGRGPRSPEQAGLEKPLLKATSQALEVPHFCALLSAKDTDGEKLPQKQQHAAKRHMATGMGFALHWLWESQHLF